MMRFLAAVLLGLAGLGVLSAPVQARTRDQVLAGTFRCAVIGSSRQWLDCYYGAAQPLRAQLGLPPVPEAQLRLVAAPPSSNVQADVAVRDQVASAAVRCNDTAEESAWLACYYAAAQPMREALGLASAAAARVPVPARTMPMANAPGSEFGVRAAPAPPRQDRIVARLTAYTFDSSKAVTVTLENGEVWRQMAGDTDILKLRKSPASYVAVITHGALGSYNLRIGGVSGALKVERLK